MLIGGPHEDLDHGTKSLCLCPWGEPIKSPSTMVGESRLHLRASGEESEHFTRYHHSKRAKQGISSECVAVLPSSLRVTSCWHKWFA
jgi:hypothetical protein